MPIRDMAKPPVRDPQLPLFDAGTPSGRPAPDRGGGATPRAVSPPPQRDGEPTRRPTSRQPPSAVETPEVLTVAKLDRLIQRVLEGATADVRVQGEVSGLHRAGSGHIYFSLKDEREDAVIDCVMYRSAPAQARKRLREGESVVLSGRVTIYPPRGRMQLIADDVLQSARGALLEALEQLKAKLAAEGLFEPARKQALPDDPRHVAVLTSRDGAAIHDVVRVAFRRGRVRILLVPTPVQGQGAAERIARAITSTDRLGCDAMIVTRGGGSAEDLAAYNDEQVVRAIAAATTPIVSAVGHEIDVTLADLAADMRAATPSQAAELIVPDYGERLTSLEHLRKRLLRATLHRFSSNRAQLTRMQARLGEPRRLVLEQAQRFDELGARLERSVTRAIGQRRSLLDASIHQLQARHPRAVLAAARADLSPLEPKLHAVLRSRLDAMRHGVLQLRPRVGSAMQQQLATQRNRLAAAVGRLQALSPLAVLSRGYAIATDEQGAVLMDASKSAAGDAVQVRLHRGRIHARVEGTEGPGEGEGEGD